MTIKTKPLMLLFALLPLSALAQEQRITVGGQPVEGIAARLTFSGDSVLIHFSDGSELKAEMGQTVIDFNAATDNIYNVTTLAAHSVSGDVLTISGLRNGDAVAIYNASGSAVAQGSAVGGTATLSLRGLPRGTYIAKTGNTIIKFLRK